MIVKNITMKKNGYPFYIVLFLLTILSGCSKLSTEKAKPVDPYATFINPLWANGADPWIYQEGGTYYYTYTHGSKVVLQKTKRISGLYESMYYPDSANTSSWTPPARTNYSSNIWAPELHKIDGKWYIYFAADNGSNANHRMYVLENTNPDPFKGTWEFKGKMTDTTDIWAIDGTVFEYKNQWYTVWSGWVSKTPTGVQNLYIAKMSNPWTIDGNRVLISTPDSGWEKDRGAINEAPEVIKNAKGEVFITFSGSYFESDNYCLGMLKLNADSDPMNKANWYKYPKPVFVRNNAGGAFGPGHNGFFKSPDGKEDWLVYHARNLPNGGSTNYRNTRIQPFTWNADGSPNFGQPVSIQERIAVPSGQQ